MTLRCPVCGDPADAVHRPFCGRGCKDRDLLKWLDEGYRIPAPVTDPDGADVDADNALDNRGRPD